MEPQKNNKEDIKYCECGVYMNNGAGCCLMCGMPMQPIKTL